METLKVRVYEGKELSYTKSGKVKNKSNVIKMYTFHYINKFLKYFQTLGPCLVVLEEVYDAKYTPGKNSVCTPMPVGRFNELKAMLEEKQSGTPEVEVDPVKAENDSLKERMAAMEKILKELPDKLGPSSEAKPGEVSGDYQRSEDDPSEKVEAKETVKDEEKKEPEKKPIVRKKKVVKKVANPAPSTEKPKVK